MRRDRITQTPYDDGEMAPEECGWMKWRFRRVLRSMYQRMVDKEIKGDLKLLDLGCREAFFATHFWDAEFRHYTGVDINKEAIEKAEARLRPTVNKEREHTLELIHGNVSDDEITDTFKDYQYFVMMELLEHLPWEYDVKLLCDIPEGKWISITIPIEPHIGLTDIYRRNREHLRGIDNVGDLDERYAFAFTRETYEVEQMVNPSVWYIHGKRSGEGFEDRT